MWQDKAFEESPFLIAEDSADDLQMLEGALRRAAVRNPRAYTRTVNDTIEWLNSALNGASEGFPVVLFLDLLMPGGNGIDVLQWLNTVPHPPFSIVLHTGVEDEELLAEARELGARFYLPKGARPEAIVEVFRRARLEWEQQHLAAY